MSNILDFISNLTFETIPEAARRTARFCLLDAVGCMVSGMNHPPLVAFARTIAEANPGSTAIAATPLSSTRAWASFINTHAGTYFDLDDGHRKAQGHPGGVIVPLSLMLAAENGCSGKQLLAAIAAGYETAVRSALIVRRAGGPRKGSGAWSVTGGTAAAAKLCSLSKAQVQNALGLAEYYAPQAPQDRSLARPSSMKEGMAWASYTAMTAVELAAAGFDAMDPFLLDASQCHDLGRNWEICSVYFKMYACCRFSHPVLDGLSALIEEYEILPDSVESITVQSFAKALLLGRTAPENPVAAMYSIPFAIGSKLIKGEVRPEDMTARALSDRRILEIAKKVTIEEDSELTALFPEKCLARVVLHLKDGRRVKSETLSAKGDPDNPYSEKELGEKFLILTQSLAGRKNQEMFDLIMNIEHESPGHLWQTLQKHE
jgi:2-methylcitrate dehydratase PrpD